MKKYVLILLLPIHIAAMDAPGTSKLEELAIEQIAEQIIKREQSLEEAQKKLSKQMYEQILERIPRYKLFFLDTLRSSEVILHPVINKAICKSAPEFPAIIWRLRIITPGKQIVGTWYFDSQRNALLFTKQFRKPTDKYSLRPFKFGKAGFYWEWKK